MAVYKYYVHGQISKLDWETLHDYAKRVGELSLTETCGAQAGEMSHLAPQVFACLAHLQDPNDTLFPSLYRLCITGTSTALDFLHLFLSASLSTLEFAEIPVHGPRYSSLLSFLASAIDEAPYIKTILFGPGQVPNRILDTFLKYRCLHRLELSEVTLPITYLVLESIGSLEQLEAFVLRDAGTSSYVPSKPAGSTSQKPVLPAAQKAKFSFGKDSSDESDDSFPNSSIKPSSAEIIAAATAAASGTTLAPKRSPSPSEWSHCSSPEPTPPTSMSGNLVAAGVEEVIQVVDNFSVPENSSVRSGKFFTLLKELTIAGSPELIEDLINYVSSPDVRQLSITFRAAVKPSSRSVAQPSKPTPTTSGIMRSRSKITAKKASPSPEKTIVYVPQKEESRIFQQIRLSMQKWAKTLGSVSLCGDGTTKPAISFPNDLFESLLLGQYTEKLELTNFDLDSVDSSLRRLKEVTPSKLKILHLPFHISTSGISLSRLRHIAQYCPQLTSFRCRFKHLSNIPTYDVPDPLSHQLEVLSVVNAEPHPEHHRLLQIAGYLDILFPNLKWIESHQGTGCNGDQWRSVLDLVKLCQAVRLADKYRLGKVNTEA